MKTPEQQEEAVAPERGALTEEILRSMIRAVAETNHRDLDPDHLEKFADSKLAELRQLAKRSPIQETDTLPSEGEIIGFMKTELVKRLKNTTGFLQELAPPSAEIIDPPEVSNTQEAHFGRFEPVHFKTHEPKVKPGESTETDFMPDGLE